MKEILDFLSRPANVAYNWLVCEALNWLDHWKRVLYEELSLRDPGFLRMLLVVKLDLDFVLVELLKTRTRPAEDVLDPVISGLACDAAERGYSGIVKLLLTQKDVDWNMCWINGDNLLKVLAGKLSACQDDEDNLRALLETKSCSVNTIGEQNSALHRAVQRGKTSITRLLLEAGADVKPRDYFGQSIMTQVMQDMVPRTWRERREMMDLLLEYKADINAHGGLGCTSLHLAIHDPLSTYFTEYLVSKGANLNLPNDRGETPLDIAKDAAKASVYSGEEEENSSNDSVERATQMVRILQKAGGKTAKEMLQPSNGEEDPCYPPEWLDREREIKEWYLVYPPRYDYISFCRRCQKETLREGTIAHVNRLANAYERHSNPNSGPSSSLTDTEKWKSMISIYYSDHSECPSSQAAIYFQQRINSRVSPYYQTPINDTQT